MVILQSNFDVLHVLNEIRENLDPSISLYIRVYRRVVMV